MSEKIPRFSRGRIIRVLLALIPLACVVTCAAVYLLGPPPFRGVRVGSERITTLDELETYLAGYLTENKAEVRAQADNCLVASFVTVTRQPSEIINCEYCLRLGKGSFVL
ncbi:MAG: hypothetical protein AAFR56_14515, partial [Chloroflexota bacterium]